MADPKFIPPLRFDLLRAIGSGQIEPLDLAVYAYLVAHSDNWRPVAGDIAKALGVSKRTAERSIARLTASGLMVKGTGSRDPSKAKPAKVTTLGLHRPSTSVVARSLSLTVTNDMSSVAVLRNEEEKLLTKTEGKRPSSVTVDVPSASPIRPAEGAAPAATEAIQESPKIITAEELRQTHRCPVPMCPKNTGAHGVAELQTHVRTHGIKVIR